MKLNSHQKRIKEEYEVYRKKTKVHDLSPIFHYFTNKYLKPILEENGYRDVIDFFVRNILRLRTDRPGLRMISYGCGNGEIEVEIAKRLRTEGDDSFHFDCIDINGEMLSRAYTLVENEGLNKQFRFIEGDVSNAGGRDVYDVHLAHHTLHHILALEELFERIQRTMHDESLVAIFLIAPWLKVFQNKLLLASILVCYVIILLISICKMNRINKYKSHHGM